MSNMDWDKMSKMYEKMKEKPGFNKVAPIEQPTPESMDGSINQSEVIGEPKEEIHIPTQEEIDAEFEAKLEEDRRIMMERLTKKKGQPIRETSTKTPKTKNVSKLEKRIEYLEEAVQLLMKQQMEMLRG